MLRTPRPRIATTVARKRLLPSLLFPRHTTSQTSQGPPYSPLPEAPPFNAPQNWNRLDAAHDNSWRDSFESAEGISQYGKIKSKPNERKTSEHFDRLVGRGVGGHSSAQWSQPRWQLPKTKTTVVADNVQTETGLRPLISKVLDDAEIPLELLMPEEHAEEKSRCSGDEVNKIYTTRERPRRHTKPAFGSLFAQRAGFQILRPVEKSKKTDKVVRRRSMVQSMVNLRPRARRSKTVPQTDEMESRTVATPENEIVASENKETAKGESAKKEFIQGLFIKLEPNHIDHEIVQKFNNTLRQAHRAIYDDKLRCNLFAVYREMKRCNRKLLYDIPKATWHRLWKIQSTFRPLDTTRQGQLKTLVRDMEFAGLNADTERQIVELEGLAETGDAETAVVQWEAQFSERAGKSRQKDWLEAGTRLYAAAGDIDRACLLLDLTIKSHHTADPRFVLFLIWRHVQSGDPSRAVKAWMLYQRLKAHATFQLSTDDYSSIFKCFLDANDRHAALQILKDVAKSNRLPDPQHRIPTLVLGMKDLHQSCRKLKFLHFVSLEALSFFPKEADLAVFFRSWLEKASEFRRQPVDPTETCAQIIELMFESGYEPSPTHLNELIRVWFMMDRPEEAESMAWNMINKRIALLEKEQEEAAKLTNPGSHSPPKIPAEPVNDTAKVPDFMKRPIPPAAARTFTHLAAYYAESDQPDYAQYVLNLLSSTSLYLNSKSLRAVIVINLTMGDPLAAWNFFHRIRRTDAAAVNLFVYNVLWKGSVANLRQIRKRFEVIGEPHYRFLKRIKRQVPDGFDKYPDPRHLFADMLHFIRTDYSLLPEATRKGARGLSIPPNLLDRVVGTFMISGDPLGALVAMQTLHSSLGLTPTKTTVEIILHYTSREAMKVEQKLPNPSPEAFDPTIFESMAKSILEYLLVNIDMPTEASEPNNQSEVSVTSTKKRKLRPSGLYEKEFCQEHGVEVLIVLGRYLRILMERYWASRERVDVYLKTCEDMMGVHGTSGYVNEEAKGGNAFKDIEDIIGDPEDEAENVFDELGMEDKDAAAAKIIGEFFGGLD
jgi:hypothetical protein